MDLLKGFIFGTIAQVITFIQLQGQLKIEWLKNNMWFGILMGMPISYLFMLSVKYLNRVSFGDNPFSQCLPAPKRRWYQFWKRLEYKTKTI